MKINLEKVKYKNILSVGQNPVEIILNKHHTTFITGSNGASKSTMIEAIIFALFGKPYRDINKPQLVNSINKKGMEVELWFNIDNKKKYYIKRGVKPNVFEIHENGVELEEDASVRDFQKYLETNIIKTNYKTAKQIVALGTAGFKPFMQLRAHERREIVEDLLDIQVFSKMVEKNKLILDDLNDSVDSLTDNIELLYKERDMRQKLLDEATKDTQDSIIEFEKKINKCDQNIHESNRELQSCKEAFKKLNDAKVPFDRSELQKEIGRRSEINSEVANIQKGIDFFEHHSKCPTCKQEIDQGWLNKKLQQYIGEREAAELELEIVKANIKSMNEANDRNVKIDKKIEEIKSKATSLKMNVEQNEKFKKQYNEEIEKLEQKNGNVDTSRLTEIAADLSDKLEQKSAEINERHCHNVVANILKDNGVKARIISQYIPVINKLINQYLKTMDANYKFELDNEFNETIKSRGREAFSYNSFSQGEKMRVDLAILFTWRELLRLKNSASFNILIMDEIMDSAADQDGIDSVMSIIRKIKDNVVIISHNDKIDPSQFDKHIAMVKKGNFSMVDKNV